MKVYVYLIASLAVLHLSEAAEPNRRKRYGSSRKEEAKHTAVCEDKAAHPSMPLEQDTFIGALKLNLVDFATKVLGVKEHPIFLPSPPDPLALALFDEYLESFVNLLKASSYPSATIEASSLSKALIKQMVDTIITNMQEIHWLWQCIVIDGDVREDYPVVHALLRRVLLELLHFWTSLNMQDQFSKRVTSAGSTNTRFFEICFDMATFTQQGALLTKREEAAILVDLCLDLQAQRTKDRFLLLLDAFVDRISPTNVLPWSWRLGDGLFFSRSSTRADDVFNRYVEKVFKHGDKLHSAHLTELGLMVHTGLIDLSKFREILGYMTENSTLELITYNLDFVRLMDLVTTSFQAFEASPRFPVVRNAVYVLPDRPSLDEAQTRSEIISIWNILCDSINKRFLADGTQTAECSSEVDIFAALLPIVRSLDSHFPGISKQIQITWLEAPQYAVSCSDVESMPGVDSLPSDFSFRVVLSKGDRLLKRIVNASKTVSHEALVDWLVKLTEIIDFLALKIKEYPEDDLARKKSISCTTTVHFQCAMLINMAWPGLHPECEDPRLVSVMNVLIQEFYNHQYWNLETSIASIHTRALLRLKNLSPALSAAFYKSQAKALLANGCNHFPTSFLSPSSAGDVDSISSMCREVFQSKNANIESSKSLLLNALISAVHSKAIGIHVVASLYPDVMSEVPSISYFNLSLYLHSRLFEAEVTAAEGDSELCERAYEFGIYFIEETCSGLPSFLSLSSQERDLNSISILYSICSAVARIVKYHPGIIWKEGPEPDASQELDVLMKADLKALNLLSMIAHSLKLWLRVVTTGLPATMQQHLFELTIHVSREMFLLLSGVRPISRLDKLLCSTAAELQSLSLFSLLKSPNTLVNVNRFAFIEPLVKASLNVHLKEVLISPILVELETNSELAASVLKLFVDTAKELTPRTDVENAPFGVKVFLAKSLMASDAALVRSQAESFAKYTLCSSHVGPFSQWRYDLIADLMRVKLLSSYFVSSVIIPSYMSAPLLGRIRIMRAALEAFKYERDKPFDFMRVLLTDMVPLKNIVQEPDTELAFETFELISQILEPEQSISSVPGLNPALAAQADTLLSHYLSLSREEYSFEGFLNGTGNPFAAEQPYSYYYRQLMLNAPLKLTLKRQLVQSIETDLQLLDSSEHMPTYFADGNGQSSVAGFVEMALRLLTHLWCEKYNIVPTDFKACIRVAYRFLPLGTKRDSLIIGLGRKAFKSFAFVGGRALLVGAFAPSWPLAQVLSSEAENLSGSSLVTASYLRYVSCRERASLPSRSYDLESSSAALGAKSLRNPITELTNSVFGLFDIFNNGYLSPRLVKEYFDAIDLFYKSEALVEVQENMLMRLVLQVLNEEYTDPKRKQRMEHCKKNLQEHKTELYELALYMKTRICEDLGILYTAGMGFDNAMKGFEGEYSRDFKKAMMVFQHINGPSWLKTISSSINEKDHDCIALIAAINRVLRASNATSGSESEPLWDILSNLPSLNVRHLEKLSPKDFPTLPMYLRLIMARSLVASTPINADVHARIGLLHALGMLFDDLGTASIPCAGIVRMSAMSVAMQRGLELILDSRFATKIASKLTACTIYAITFMIACPRSRPNTTASMASLLDLVLEYEHQREVSQPSLIDHFASQVCDQAQFMTGSEKECFNLIFRVNNCSKNISMDSFAFLGHPNKLIHMLADRYDKLTGTMVLQWPSENVASLVELLLNTDTVGLKGLASQLKELKLLTPTCSYRVVISACLKVIISACANTEAQCPCASSATATADTMASLMLSMIELDPLAFYILLNTHTQNQILSYFFKHVGANGLPDFAKIIEYLAVVGNEHINKFFADSTALIRPSTYAFPDSWDWKGFVSHLSKTAMMDCFIDNYLANLQRSASSSTELSLVSSSHFMFLLHLMHCGCVFDQATFERMSHVFFSVSTSATEIMEQLRILHTFFERNCALFEPVRNGLLVSSALQVIRKATEIEGQDDLLVFFKDLNWLMHMRDAESHGKWIDSFEPEMKAYLRLVIRGRVDPAFLEESTEMFNAAISLLQDKKRNFADAFNWDCLAPERFRVVPTQHCGSLLRLFCSRLPGSSEPDMKRAVRLFGSIGRVLVQEKRTKLVGGIFNTVECLQCPRKAKLDFVQAMCSEELSIERVCELLLKVVPDLMAHELTEIPGAIQHLEMLLKEDRERGINALRQIASRSTKIRQVIGLVDGASLSESLHVLEVLPHCEDLEMINALTQWTRAQFGLDSSIETRYTLLAFALNSNAITALFTLGSQPAAEQGREVLKLMSDLAGHSWASAEAEHEDVVNPVGWLMAQTYLFPGVARAMSRPSKAWTFEECSRVEAAITAQLAWLRAGNDPELKRTKTLLKLLSVGPQLLGKYPVLKSVFETAFPSICHEHVAPAASALPAKSSAKSGSEKGKSALRLNCKQASSKAADEHETVPQRGSLLLTVNPELLVRIVQAVLTRIDATAEKRAAFISALLVYNPYRLAWCAVMDGLRQHNSFELRNIFNKAFKSLELHAASQTNSEACRSHSSLADVVKEFGLD